MIFDLPSDAGDEEGDGGRAERVLLARHLRLRAPGILAFRAFSAIPTSVV